MELEKSVHLYAAQKLGDLTEMRPEVLLTGPGLAQHRPTSDGAEVVNLVADRIEEEMCSIG